MSGLLENIQAHAQTGLHLDEERGKLNTFIDAFVHVGNAVSQSPDGKTDPGQMNNSLANALVDLIEAYNRSDLSNCSTILFHRIVPDFIKWKLSVEACLKYEIIICGINQYCDFLHRIINFNRVHIVAFFDESERNVGNCINDIRIIGRDDLGSYPFDYLFLLDDIKSFPNVAADKICNFFRHGLIDADFDFYRRYYAFMDGEKNFEGLITGLSHVAVGINTNLMTKKFFNFAVPSQDLFYDFQICKFVFRFEPLRRTVKHVIIGLPYYGFGYDLSKSKNVRTIRTEIYYPITGTLHNYEYADSFIREYDQYRQICRKLLKPDYSRSIFEHYQENHERHTHETLNQVFDSRCLTPAQRNHFIEEINRDFKKRYPLTVQENREILRQYLDFLITAEIKPMILVCPVSKMYRNHASAEIMNEFQAIINDLNREFPFQFIDLFSSDAFDDSDFCDPSHLNSKGAGKLTGILNSFLM